MAAIPMLLLKSSVISHITKLIRPRVDEDLRSISADTSDHEDFQTFCKVRQNPPSDKNNKFRTCLVGFHYPLLRISIFLESIWMFLYHPDPTSFIFGLTVKHDLIPILG